MAKGLRVKEKYTVVKRARESCGKIRTRFVGGGVLMLLIYDVLALPAAISTSVLSCRKAVGTCGRSGGVPRAFRVSSKDKRGMATITGSSGISISTGTACVHSVPKGGKGGLMEICLNANMREITMYSGN